MDSLATDSTLISEAWAQTGLFVLLNKSFPIVVGDTIVGGPRGSSESETDVEENEINSNIQIYPNPNSGIFTLNWKQVEVEEIIVYDMQGKEVFRQEISSQNSAKIKLPNSLTGLMQLVLLNKQGTMMFSEKLLVND